MRKILICLIGVLFQADGVPPSGFFTNCISRLKAIFSEIDRIIHYVNSQKTTWTAGIPALSRNSMLKTLVTDAATIGFKIQNFGVSQANSDLSPSFDARERWPECMSIPQINDISECSEFCFKFQNMNGNGLNFSETSWAFAAAESMSDRLCINSGGFKNTILSAEELLSCCTGMFSCGEG